MRHNDARKWLHAGLDLLPLILIPVFMIYSHRHTIDSGSIDVPINRVVDFNQFYSITDQTYEENNVVFTIDESGINIITGNATSQATWWIFNNDLYSHNGNKVYIHFENCPSNVILNNVGQSSNIVTIDNTISYGFVVNTGSPVNYTTPINFIDLTQMFGRGNEPTIQEFESLYNGYYDYTMSSKQLLKGYSSQTYDDTDIMSQFTYQLYNSVDKYFNMGNVFGMSYVYDWFVLNIFGGNASISIYIVWNIVLYEFVMDLLFLLYGLFMWFIDMMKHLMEKPFRSIK